MMELERQGNVLLVAHQAVLRWALLRVAIEAPNWIFPGASWVTSLTGTCLSYQRYHSNYPNFIRFCENLFGLVYLLFPGPWKTFPISKCLCILWSSWPHKRMDVRQSSSGRIMEDPFLMVMNWNWNPCNFVVWTISDGTVYMIWPVWRDFLGFSYPNKVLLGWLWSQF